MKGSNRPERRERLALSAAARRSERSDLKPLSSQTMREKAADFFRRAERATTPGARSRFLLQAARLLGRAEGEEDFARREAKRHASPGSKAS
jgi:hypothetical protein